MNKTDPVELVYFDTSAIQHFMRLGHEAFLGTRDLQKLRGRELLISPVTLWELMLSPGDETADYLIFFAQHIFSPRLLATPGELLRRYMVHAYPRNEVNYGISTDLPIGSLWARMAEDPSVRMLWDDNVHRDRSAFLRRISTNLSGIVHYPQHEIAQPEIEAIARVVNVAFQIGREDGVIPCVSDDRHDADLFQKITLLFILLFTVFKLDFVSGALDDFWEKAGLAEGDAVGRLQHMLEQYPELFLRGPVCEMTAMAYHQLSEGRRNRGTLFDSMHMVYAPYVHTILTADEDFRSLRAAEPRYGGKIRHIDEIGLRSEPYLSRPPRPAT